MAEGLDDGPEYTPDGDIYFNSVRTGIMQIWRTPVCAGGQNPAALSAMLLIDVEAGLCEKASRIDEAVTAVQCFVQRARLGLEPGWHVGREFARMWDARFATFAVWEKCKRRELYQENWVEWDDLERARKVEAFQLLEQQLRRATLTVAVPGGVDYWPGDRPPEHPS